MGPIVNGGKRDAAGRFRLGNPGGPGAPRGGGYRQLRQAVAASITPETIARIIGGLVERAVAGDVRACELLLAYGIGRPLDEKSYRWIAQNDEQDADDAATASG